MGVAARGHRWAVGVRSDDARRIRQSIESTADITDHKGDPVVWLMLGVNLVCFITITFCYIVINI